MWGLIGAILLCFSLGAEEYDFYGKHFIASYYGCDAEALEDVEGLKNAMVDATKESGAELLDFSDVHFDGGGYTAVILLSESHASIHTYPEHSACFVDLFTCGDHCSSKDFDRILHDYLNPDDTHERLLERK